MILHPSDLTEVFEIRDLPAVGVSRRGVARMARAAGFEDVDIGRAELVVTEAATNLVRHAGYGEIWATLVRHGDASCLKVHAVDEGPGLRSLESFRDGVSRDGGLGLGLGAMDRLSEAFGAISAAGRGTCVFASICPGRETPSDQGVFGVVFAMDGHSESGDGWSASISPRRRTVVLVDALGHGKRASEEKHRALEAFAALSPSPEPDVVINAIAKVATQRGVVAAVATIDDEEGKLRFASVGNISARLVDAAGVETRLIGRDGIVGRAGPSVTERPWSDSSQLLMHTDGFGSRWAVDVVATDPIPHPGAMVAAMARTAKRRNDDGGFVLVVGRGGSPSAQSDG